MKVRRLHSWPATVDAATAIQDKLRPLVSAAGPGPSTVRSVAGVDVAYASDSDRLTAAVVVLNVATLDVIEEIALPGRVDFPYVAGLLAFRELPALVAALEQLETVPDLMICDGQGLAHPRRFGLACHLGVLTELPAIGVAKTPLGHYEPPASQRGSWTELRDAGEVVGRALRTQDGVKPVFVSVGHNIDVEAACREVLRLSPRYRLPEPTRLADQLARRVLSAGGSRTS